jgi:hypothetical protein
VSPVSKLIRSASRGGNSIMRHPGNTWTTILAHSSATCNLTAA